MGGASLAHTEGSGSPRCGGHHPGIDDTTQHRPYRTHCHPRCEGVAASVGSPIANLEMSPILWHPRPVRRQRVTRIVDYCRKDLRAYTIIVNTLRDCRGNRRTNSTPR